MLSWLTKRRIQVVAACALIASGWFVVATVESILWPRQEVPDRVDAVAILAGGGGEREVFGLAAVELGLADTIIVSRSLSPAKLCSGTETEPEIQVICLDTSGDTATEAALISQTAERNDIENILLVTSSYHLQRAERWLDRCFAGEIFPLAADAAVDRSTIGRELLATFGQVTYQRSCPDL